MSVSLFVLYEYLGFVPKFVLICISPSLNIVDVHPRMFMFFLSCTSLLVHSSSRSPPTCRVCACLLACVFFAVSKIGSFPDSGAEQRHQFGLVSEDRPMIALNLWQMCSIQFSCSQFQRKIIVPKHLRKGTVSSLTDAHSQAFTDRLGELLIF